MSTGEWRLRVFRPGDEAGISTLFARGYGEHREKSVWRSRYRPGRDPVWLAVDGDDEPVFHYAAVSRTLDHRDGSRPALIAFDAVTDPRYRRRGIFSAAMERAHADWKAAGFSCILGLPNEQWGSRIEAFDWRELFALRWQIRPLRPERMLARRTGISAIRRMTLLGRIASLPWPPVHDASLETKSVCPPSEQVDALWRGCLEEGKTGLNRSREWMQHRFPKAPGREHRFLAVHRAGSLAGYLVYRFEAATGYGFVPEILTRPSDRSARRALLREAVRRLAAEGAVAVAALAVPGTELATSLRGAGFLFSWGAFTVRCVPLSSELPFDELREPERWWLCGGDFDVV